MSKKKAVSQKLSAFPTDYAAWVLSLKRTTGSALEIRNSLTYSYKSTECCHGKII